MSLPVHLAVHSWGVARRVPGGVATRSAFGPYVEALADAVERVTLVAYDPPPEPARTEDLTEFVARPQRDNLDMLSLGPKGGRQDYLGRRRRVARIVRECSPAWDVLLFRIVNRRANLVFRANRCPRVVSIIGASSLEHLLRSEVSLLEKAGQIPHTLRTEWNQRRIMKGSHLVFANGEELVDRYRSVVPNIRLLRSSARRARYSYLPPDRLDRPDPRFLIAGQIKADKGVFDALEAFGRIRKTLLPGAELHVAGIGQDLDDLRVRAGKLGLEEAVTFHGWIPGGDEFFGLLRQMDVLLCLSHADFLPRVVWESLAHGVLVVCTEVGSLPRAFTREREVMFVPPGSIEAVEAAVAQLLSSRSLRLEILRQGFERARESSLEAVVGALLDQIRSRWPELAQRQPSESR